MLLPLEYFEPIFKPYSGKRCLHLANMGNVGDLLIWKATVQLCMRFKIKCHSISWEDHVKSRGAADYDVVFHCGGGNMGSTYEKCVTTRQEIADWVKQHRLKYVMLPQSWSSPEEIAADTIYVRERASLQFEPRGILAPDLALGYELEQQDLKYIQQYQHQYDTGNFFREDIEQTKVPENNLGDPVFMVKSLKDYLLLASRFKKIHTNRLHFAIAGLITGNMVYLYDNSYGKNKALFDAWLCKLKQIEFREI